MRGSHKKAFPILDSEVNPTEEAVIYQEEGGKGLKDYSREHLRYLSTLES